MQSEEPRRRSGAIIFVSLVALIIIGIGTVAVAVTSSPGQGGGSSATTTDQALGLRLSLQVSPGSGPSGTTFQVNASVTNILPRTNTVSGLNDYNGVGSNPICKFAPIMFDVLQGHYTVANYSSGTPVSVHGPDVFMCVLGTADLSYYVFQPNSDNFTGPSLEGGQQLGRNAQISVDVSQVYSEGLNSKAPLPAGEYTVVAADNWGQLAVAYFTVS